jgi:predicted nucleic acid-binding Zn ribbon protein
VRQAYRRVEPIGKVLAEVVRNLGISRKLSEQRAVVDWQKIVGRRIAEHSRATRVDSGRLFVEVDSSVWAQELTLMKRTILRQVNDRTGSATIENIHFVIGGASRHGASHSGSKED